MMFVSQSGNPMVDVQLHLGDCLEFMRGMPDKSVDAVITDPPYGVGVAYSSYEDTEDNLQKLIAAFVPECIRVARSNVAITCGVANLQRYPVGRWNLAWFWRNTNSTGKWGFSTWQPVIVYGKDPWLVNGKGRKQDSKEFGGGSSDIGKFEHPCPKPLDVMNWLADRCSMPGDTIFDPFMGSGTTGVACVRTGRNFIGCEIDPGYFAIAEKRIADAQKQIRMPL